VAPRQVKTILLSEGLIVDPIGAVLAYVTLQWIAHTDVPLRELASTMMTLTVTGVVIGFVAGAMANFVVRRRVVTGELRNLTILALLMVCYLVAERQAHQSGILAAMVMGFTMSAAELPDLTSVKAFKGQLTTLVISVLFILLAGQLRMEAIADLGLGGVFVVAALVLVVRPLSIAASIWPRQLGWRERLILAMTAPRGIVAAAVASLAAREMTVLGVAGGSEMEGLVYLAILVTGAWSTVVAVVLPWLLGYTKDPTRRLGVVVGANRLTEELARLLGFGGRTTVVVDVVSWRLDRLRAAGYATVCGDARDAVTYEEAGTQRDTLVVTATTNDELNLLVAELVHSEFGVENPVVALQRPPDEFGRRSRAWMDLLGGRAMDVPGWIRGLENGQAAVMEIDAREPASLSLLREVEREHSSEVCRLLCRSGEQLSVRVDDAALEQAERLYLLVANGRARTILEGERADDQSADEPA
jgi:hypothetical protein